MRGSLCRALAILFRDVLYRLPSCKVPVQARFRSDNYAAVLLCSDFCQ